MAATWRRRLQTIREMRPDELLEQTIGDVFPGSRLDITVFRGRFDVRLHQHGLLRSMGAAE